MTCRAWSPCNGRYPSWCSDWSCRIPRSLSPRNNSSWRQVHLVLTEDPCRRVNNIFDQPDLVVSVSIQVRRVGVVLRLECRDEVFHDIAGVGWIELDDADVTQRSLAGLLLEPEWQPNGADLNCIATAAFGNPGLRQCLGYF